MNSMSAERRECIVERILMSARQSRMKGDYRTFEQYKHQLDRVNLTGSEYGAACAELAEALRV